MLCNDFEDRMTDYLDGVLEPDMHKAFAEHALRCPVCHETLSEVKNTMLSCRAANGLETPEELEARILLSTMPETAMTCEDFEEFLTDYLDGFLPASLYHRWERHAVLCARCTELPGEVVLASWLRVWLDPIISPQLATVATMLLVAVFVLTNTVSADGSISGVYSASLRLAERSYAGGSGGGIKEITQGLKELVGGQHQSTPPASEQSQPKQSPKQNGAPNKNRQNKP